jgi:hypothetical protein
VQILEPSEDCVLELDPEATEILVEVSIEAEDDLTEISDISLWVNDTEVVLSLEGDTWTASVTLSAGDYTLSVVAQDGRGNETSSSRQVSVEAAASDSTSEDSTGDSGASSGELVNSSLCTATHGSTAWIVGLVGLVVGWLRRRARW